MDDQFDLGSYAPSMVNNSRSGSMKKLTRKTDTSPKPQQKKPIKKNNDFDQLDDLLNGDIMVKKKDTSLNKKSSTSQPKKMNDTLDSFFDQPSTNLNITSKISEKKDIIPNNMDFARTSINFKLQKKNQFDIIEQGNDYIPNFSKVSRQKQRPKSPTVNQIKIPEQSLTLFQTQGSMRSMRPPLKRKQSQTGLGQRNNTSNTMNLGLSFAEQKNFPNKTNNNLGLSLDEQTDMKPLRSMNLGRRGSVDNKSQKKFDTGLTLFGDQSNKRQTNISHFNIPDRNQTSALRIDSPKNKGKSQISDVKIGQSIMINEKHSQFYSSHQNTSILKGDSSKENYKQLDLSKKDSHYSFQPTQQRLVAPPKLSTLNMIDEQKKNSYDYQKQVEHLKQTYQKQLSYVEQSLDKQMKVNQQTRQRLMKQANKMIEEERERSKRIHEEQINRMKQINEWQNKKMHESYNFQIQNLKSTINQYQTANNNQNGSNNQIYDQRDNRHRREIEQLSQRLQLQKKLLLDRQHHLTKRQLQLQQRQQEFANKKRKDDDYYREQQKQIMQKQNKLRNSILNEKKQLMEQKQTIAMEAANMELDIIKRKQKLDLLLNEAQIHKQAIQKERHQVRTLNQQMMARYKQKMNELAQDKQRVSNLQSDLIRKLRIIQLKAKQSNVPLNQTYQNTSAKQNNWVKQRPSSTAGQKQEKFNQKQQRLNETFQRYNKVQKIANQTSSNAPKLNKTIGQQANQTFRLQDYMKAMNKNSKLRQNNFI